MYKLKNIPKNLFIAPRWFVSMGVFLVLFLVSFFLESLFFTSIILFILFLSFSLFDIFLLFFFQKKLIGERIVSNKLSLADDNTITLKLENQFPFSIHLAIIDELPNQFQSRNFSIKARLNFNQSKELQYILNPKKRGLYSFGNLMGFVESPIRLFQRRLILDGTKSVKVYPSFLHIRKFQILTQATNGNFGDRKVRKIGNSLEFEKIKDYVFGDDIRNINWKATARKGGLMTNTYTDARQQQIYCVIDKGRTMKMPFDDLSLLDYSINASLNLLNIALLKQDKAGLITFSKNNFEIIPAERQNKQFTKIQESLFAQETEFKESDYNSLRSNIQKHIGQRSLLLLFTNFETSISLKRQLPNFSFLAKKHLLCIIIFENTLLKHLKDTNAQSLKDVYIQTIAKQFDYEKKQIVLELRKHGILTILTTPKNLNVDVINQYLDLKSKHLV